MSTFVQPRQTAAKELSYGVICAHIPNGDGDVKQKVSEPLFLCVERMTSIGFICLYTGQYSCSHAPYLKKLLKNCTYDEAKAISSGNYAAVTSWLNERSGGKSYKYRNNYETRYKRLFDNPACRLDTLFEECVNEGHVWPTHPDIEFPKGRKEGKETDRETAMREFSEEASLPETYDIELLPGEYMYSYTGINNRPYSTIYFTALITSDTASLLDTDKVRLNNEVYANHWLTFSQYKQRTYGNTSHRHRIKILEAFRNSLFKISQRASSPSKTCAH